MDADEARQPGVKGDARPALREAAWQALQKLSPAEREALLIQCWMSHDARWFMAAALTCGMDAPQRINKLAVREEGRVEARRLSRRLGLRPITTAREYLLLQETLISLLGPDLLDYQVIESPDGFDLEVQRCFAFDNVTKAGFADKYECGILPRLLGWLDFTQLDCELSPEPGRCLMAQGQACRYSFRYLQRPREPKLGM